MYTIPAACALSSLNMLLHVQIPLAVGNVFLVLRAACCVSANLTVCELLTRKRYAYLTRDGDGAFVNPFDRGVASNCIQFWGGSAPDWGQELHVGTEVRQDVTLVQCIRIMSNPCLKAHAASWQYRQPVCAWQRILIQICRLIDGAARLSLVCHVVSAALIFRLLDICG